MEITIKIFTDTFEEGDFKKEIIRVVTENNMIKDKKYPILKQGEIFKDLPEAHKYVKEFIKQNINK